MSNSVKKMPVKTEENAPHPAKTDLRHPFEKLRQQVDRLFDDFNRGTGISPFSRGLFDVEPFWRREFSTSSLPAVDISEKEKSFEITAELPGMDQKDIEIRLANGNLIIKGRKRNQGRKEKGLSPVRAPLRFLRARVQPAKRRRQRQDRSPVQQRRADADTAKKTEALKAEKVVPIKAD